MLNVKRGSDATDQTSVRVTIVGKTDDVAGCPVSVGVGEAFDTLLFAVASNDKTRITEGNKNRWAVQLEYSVYNFVTSAKLVLENNVNPYA